VSKVAGETFRTDDNNDWTHKLVDGEWKVQARGFSPKQYEEQLKKQPRLFGRLVPFKD